MSRPNNLQQFFGSTSPYQIEQKILQRNLQRVSEVRESSSSSNLAYDEHSRRKNPSAIENIANSLALNKGSKLSYTPTFAPLGVRPVPSPPSNVRDPVADIENTRIAEEQRRKLRELLSAELEEPRIERANRPGTSSHIGISTFVSKQKVVDDDRPVIISAISAANHAHPIPSWLNSALAASNSTPITPADITPLVRTSEKSASVAQTATDINTTTAKTTNTGSRHVTVGGLRYFYNAATVASLLEREPTCIFFTQDEWNLEPRSFAQINSYICGYDVDSSVLSNPYVIKCFNKDTTTLNMPNLANAISSSYNATLSSYNSTLQQLKLIFAGIDAVADKKNLGIPSAGKTLTTVFQNDPDLLHRLALAACAGDGNPLLSLLMAFSKHFLVDGISSPIAVGFISGLLGTTVNSNQRESPVETVRRSQSPPSAMEEYLSNSQRLVDEEGDISPKMTFEVRKVVIPALDTFFTKEELDHLQQEHEEDAAFEATLAHLKAAPSMETSSNNP